jgi:predicted Rossmann fold flavoprotein
MPVERSKRPIVVVGAGAAGLMAAIAAGDGDRPVLVLQSGDRPGAKILISGGGRCNVLPGEGATSYDAPKTAGLAVSAGAPPVDGPQKTGPSLDDLFVTSGSQNTLRKILRGWPLPSVRHFFEEALQVPLQLEPESGKLFPVANKAIVVLQALLNAVRARGGDLRYNATVTGLTHESHWWVHLENGERVAAERVIFATGGLSVPATGSDGGGLKIAAQLGHRVTPTYAALAPLTCNDSIHHALTGLSLPVRIRATGPDGRTHSAEGGFLFTHKGYSGPVVLNLSHLAAQWQTEHGKRPVFRVQWSELDVAAWEEMLREATINQPAGFVFPMLCERMPNRLASTLINEANMGGIKLSQLSKEQRRQLAELLGAYPLPWDGTEGFRTAEVTGGGVALDQVDPATMESRSHPGLYFCGEMLDAFGPIGGYNFLWAWITGKLAGVACRQL